MSSVFISYARVDAGFVHQLHSRLIAAQREPWVDWDDIPPSAEFMKTIYTAIESADAFVFVLSPVSIASATCALELAHAVEFKKPIIPVVYQDVEISTVPAAVAPLNWIFMRTDDDFDAAFNKLLVALDTDLDYWREASQLLIRARQWEAKQQNASIVLRGSELSGAEQWLAEGATKQPTPTALHVRFITASRRAANRRQRMIIALMSAVSVVLVVLTGLSFSFSQLAQQQTREALRQRQIALSRQLIAEANSSLFGRQTAPALLLAARAFQVDNNPLTRDTLLSTLVDSPRLKTLWWDHAAASGLVDVAFSPNGQSVLSLADNGAVERWDVTTHQRTALFQVPEVGGGQKTLILSPDGSQVVTNYDNSLQAWDARSGAAESSYADGLAPFSSFPSIADYGSTTSTLLADARFTADGSRFMAAAYTDEYFAGRGSSVQFWVWDAKTRQQISAMAPQPADWTTALAISSDGRLLAQNTCADATCLTGQVLLWDMAAEQIVARLPFARESMAAFPKFSPDGKQLWMVSGTTVQIWDVHTLAVLATFTVAVTEIDGLSFNPKDQTVIFQGCAAFSCTQGQLMLLNVNNLPLINTESDLGTPLADHIAYVSDVAFAPDGQTLVSVDGSNHIAQWNLASFDPASHRFGTVFLGQQIAFSPDGNLLASDGQDPSRPLETVGGTVLWDVASGSIAASIPNLFMPAFSPDGRLIAGVMPDHSVVLWDWHAKQQVRTLAPDADVSSLEMPTLSFSVDGKTLAGEYPARAGGLAAIAFWDVTTGVLAHTYIGPVSLHAVTSWALAPDFKTVVIADGTTILVQDTVTGATLGQPLPRPVASSVDMTFSPDGRTLATRGVSGAISLWDVRTWKVTAQVLPDLGGNGADNPTVQSRPHETMLFSRDGRLLATNWNSSLSIWDVVHQEFLVHMSHFQRGARSLAFSPDGQLLAGLHIGVLEDTLVTLPLAPAVWKALACQVAGRNLTHTEWQGLDPVEPYTTICPGLPSA